MPTGDGAEVPPLARPPSVTMRWESLLMLHWPVDPAGVRRLIPEPLEIDLIAERAWVALVPFRMERTRFRRFPDLPGLSSFYECNVRTYVRCAGVRGVWFFSLDAERLIPVLGGRWIWSLNYLHSRFHVQRSADRVEYQVQRRRRPGARLRVVWEAGEPMPPSRRGSIEHSLSEVYSLFTLRHGRVCVARIAHEPWTFRRAIVRDLDDSLVACAGLRVSGTPLAWHADSLDVRGWGLEPADAGERGVVTRTGSVGTGRR